MKTIILPGYSPRNKDWAYEVKDRLDLGHKVLVHEWKHWGGGKFSLNTERSNILENIRIEEVNIIAKSVGTRVLMSLVGEIEDRINKVILCGIPVDPVRYTKGIKLIGAKRLLVIQNKKDPLMPSKPIKLFMKLIDKNIKVLEMPRSDHDYPYFKEFQKFLLA